MLSHQQMLCIQRGCSRTAAPLTTMSQNSSKSDKAMTHPVLDVISGDKCTWQFLMATKAELLL